MRKNIRRRQEAHRRAQDVCEKNRTIIDANDATKAKAATLSASVDEVDRLLNDQGHALDTRRAESQKARDARQAIRDIVSPIVTLSRFVVLDQGTAMVMRVPADASDEQLVMDAGVIADAVEAHADGFTKAGLPAGDAADLRAQIAALKAAKTAASNARKAFTVAAKGIRKALKSGDDAIVGVDAILTRTPTADPDVLDKLRLAKVVGPSHAGEAPAPAAQPAPEPTTPTKAA